MFAIYRALSLPSIPLLASLQTHELLVYQCAETESRIRFQFCVVTDGDLLNIRPFRVSDSRFVKQLSNTHRG